MYLHLVVRLKYRKQIIWMAVTGSVPACKLFNDPIPCPVCSFNAKTAVHWFSLVEVTVAIDFNYYPGSRGRRSNFSNIFVPTLW